LIHLLNKAKVPNMWFKSEVLEMRLVADTSEAVLLGMLKNSGEHIPVDYLRSWVVDDNILDRTIRLFDLLGEVNSINNFSDLLISFLSLERIPEKILKMWLMTDTCEAVLFGLFKNMGKHIPVNNLWGRVVDDKRAFSLFDLLGNVYFINNFSDFLISFLSLERIPEKILHP